MPSLPAETPDADVLDALCCVFQGQKTMAGELCVTTQAVTNWRRRGISGGKRIDVFLLAADHGIELPTVWVKARP